MSRRIIARPVRLAVAVVPAAASLQPAKDPSPRRQPCGVVYGDTKYDLQNQQDSRPAPSAYEQAISGDTKGDLPRAIAPAGTPAAYAPPSPRRRQSAPYGVARRHRPTAGRSPPWAEAAVLAAFALGAAALVARRQHRAPHMGV